MASASGISRQRPLRAVRQTEIVCVQNLFDLADQRSRDVLMEMHGAEHRARAFLPAGVAARCAEPDPREPGTRRAGGEAGGDTRADRARLAARSRAERPTHTGNPHPISSDRAPESSGDSARSILRLGHITPATRRGTRCSRWTRSTRNCPAASTSSSSASTSAIEPPSRPDPARRAGSSLPGWAARRRPARGRLPAAGCAGRSAGAPLPGWARASARRQRRSHWLRPQAPAESDQKPRRSLTMIAVTRPGVTTLLMTRMLFTPLGTP
jgi:hypothetical protein